MKGFTNIAALLLFLLLCLGCKNSNENKNNPLVKLTLEEQLIVSTFAEVDSLLTIDNGKFWGEKLNGGLLFVNPKTKIFYANQNNLNNTFENKGAFYSDTLPKTINIANTAIEWEGKKWSIVMLPLPNERNTRNGLIIHELFHQLQPKIGFNDLKELDNGHLDEYQPRLLLKLEIEALNTAIETNDPNLKQVHIKNALICRLKRQSSHTIKEAENALELNEGLAEYTGFKLSRRKAKDVEIYFTKTKQIFYNNPTFVRSFAYQTILRYGYLLSLVKPNWHKKVNSNSNLTDVFITMFNVEISNELANELSIEEIVSTYDYNYGKINEEEVKRAQIRKEEIVKLKTKFIDNPTLEIKFQNMNISFDPRNIISLKGHGVVYPQVRVTDNWGILTIEKGGLISSNWDKIIVTAPIDISDLSVIGDGWKLELNLEWKVEKVNNKFNLLKK